MFTRPTSKLAKTCAATMGFAVLIASPLAAEEAATAAAPAAPVAVEVEAPATAEAAAPAAADAAAAEPATDTADAANTTAEAQPSEAAQTSASNLKLDALAIGTPVIGSDGEKIGEVNRVTAGAGGTVTEIQVTTGGPAGLDAEAVAVPADKISSAGEAVKLSLRASDVKALPVVRPGAG